MKRVRRIDFSGRIAKPGSERGDAAFTATKTPQGFLRVEGRFQRDGSLEYSDGESTWREYRSPAAVDASLDSFKNTIVTLGHPDELVTVENVAELQRGHAGSNPNRDEEMPNWVRIDFLVTHQDALDAIERGVAELSVGFTALVRPQSGVDEQGLPYSFVQEDVEGNHIAIVEEGRAGPEGRLLLDARKDHADETAGEWVRAPKFAIQIKTDGEPIVTTLKKKKNDEGTEMVEIDIEGAKVSIPKAVADLIEQLRANQEAPAEGGEEEEEEEPMAESASSDSKDRLSALQAKCDAQEEQLRVLLADKAGRSRSDLLATARRIGAKVDASKCKTDADIMRAVVIDRLPGLKAKLDEHKDDAGYLRALFDQAVEVADVRKSEEVTNAINGALFSAGGGEYTDHMDELIKTEEEAV